MSQRTKVSIVEDNPGTRESLTKMLERMPELEFLRAYATGEAALAGIASAPPEVMLMDIRLPGMSGIECVARVKEKLPGVAVLMLTTYEESDLIFESLRAGAVGYLLKNMPAAELMNAVVQARTGGSPLSMRIARKIVNHFQKIESPASDLSQLTKREQEILSLLSKGFLYKEIADRLRISPNTVGVHLQNVYEKLRVHSRTQAVMRFLGQKTDLPES
jgi:DNA-binding NarL/FixJ family response regulator